MNRLRSRLRKLRWKLTWSYTWVAALSFLVVETILLVIVFLAVGLNPLRRDGNYLSGVVQPVLDDDIRPITFAHMRAQSIDGPAIQADLEQILGVQPSLVSATLYEGDQFSSVFVLDPEQHLLASTPQFTALPPDGRFFDPDLLTSDDSLALLLEAAFSGTPGPEQPYIRESSDATHLVFVEANRDGAGRLLGVLVVVFRTPTPAAVLLIVLGVTVGGLAIFALAAALFGTLFGWRSAEGFSGRLAHLSDTAAAWGQGNFDRDIRDAGEDEIGELGQNLNRVAADLQELLADKEQLAVMEERDRMARELHDTLAQGVSGLVLQLEAVKHYLNAGNVPQSQEIVGDAVSQARAALHTARAAISDLREEAMLAPDFLETVRRLAAEAGKSGGFACEVDAQLPETLVLEPRIALHARRSLSEILANVSHHADAVSVKLLVRLEDGALVMEVEDDGVGFDVAAAVQPGHYGLVGLRERARLNGGRFTLESSPGVGTTARMRLPLEGTDD